MYLFVLGFFHHYAILTGHSNNQFSRQVNCLAAVKTCSYGAVVYLVHVLISRMYFS